jgi:hypothetical protein
VATTKTNLIAVSALAILTAQCVTRSNEITLRPAIDGVLRLANDPGGLLAAYENRFIQARENGERVVIDGACLSACTLAVGLLPPGRVCATPKAVLGFAEAYTPMPGTTDAMENKADRIPSFEATRKVMSIYPPVLQQWIKQHGGLTPNMIFLKGKELAAIVPRCSASE